MPTEFTAPIDYDEVISAQADHKLNVTVVDPFSVHIESVSVVVEPPPPPPPPVHNSNWHGPDGLTHEHGDPPPDWVLNSVHPPFSQSREAHHFYKGFSAAMSNGVEGYLINHIAPTHAGRHHGDHDFQLWVRDPSGGTSYWEGVSHYAEDESDPTGPIFIHVRANPDDDPGIRPIILVSVDKSCETWYSRPGSGIADQGTTVCGVWEDVDGVGRGDGTFRSVDWVIPKDRLYSFGGDVAPTLEQYAVVEFGVERFSFVRSSVEYGEVVGPN